MAKNSIHIRDKFFSINSPSEYKEIALEVFLFQYNNSLLYKAFVDSLKVNPNSVKEIEQIPFLPIQFFKSHEIITQGSVADKLFLSSGTTGMSPSRHFVADISLYEKSFLKGFQYFYGDPEEYCFLALLPSYLEREGSSLVYMMEKLISYSKHKESGFYLNNYPELVDNLVQLKKQKVRIILIGVTYALIDIAEHYEFDLSGVIIMETGGMKGRRREMVREELHEILSNSFNAEFIHSEYGMTELLSQAYSKGEGVFETPPWMKVLIRETNDPFSLLSHSKTGGINVIDLANLYSCSFIATQDLGKLNADGSFEVLGRFDNSDIRGCNLMI